MELLAPAGDPRKFQIALDYGADAVYGGVSHFSLRARSAKEFTIETFAECVRASHDRGKKIFAAINGFPFNNQIKMLENHLAAMRDAAPDAFIVSSPGVIRLAKKIAPNMPLHLSTQANALNTLDCEAYYEMGVRRVIAAREMSLKDLEAIKAALPALELEIFLHGSMCFAFSGRCLVSSLQSGRVANRGSCANDCRFPYAIYAENPETGTLFRVEEREEGTYLFNAKDLKMIARLREIVSSGAVDSVKIEGRTKSAYYCACAVRAYRAALDDIAAGRFDLEFYEAELSTLKNRGYTDGYLVRRPFERLDTQNFAATQLNGASEVAAIVDFAGGAGFHSLGKVATGGVYEAIAPLDKMSVIAEVENEIGKIFRKGSRVFVEFKQIAIAGEASNAPVKFLDSIHSGNEKAALLPAPLPINTFLRTPFQS
ncbi:MAG: U32 family peptidase [Helicobacteraceae bacterium]|jgi:putative protease|nr:U32 family peptidase [Helicobacteraceae bacterium]